MPEQEGCRSILLTDCNARVIEASVRQLVSNVEIVDFSSTPRGSELKLQEKRPVAFNCIEGKER